MPVGPLSSPAARSRYLMRQDLQPQRKPLCDCLAVRKNYDIFVRPEGMTEAPEMNKRGWPEYEAEFDWDDQVRAAIPIFRTEELVASSVSIKVILDDRTTIVGNGVLVSQSIIFTCGHIFAYPNIQSIQASFRSESKTITCPATLELAPRFPDGAPVKWYHILGTNQMGRWTKDYLDFAVLKIVIDSPSCITPLTVSTHGTDRPEGEPICMCGLAPDPATITDAVFSSDFNDSLTNNGAVRNRIKREVIRKNFGKPGKRTPVCCFGATLCPTIRSNATKGYYYLSTMSCVKGLSGSPVVAMKDPDRLLGITVGTLEDGEGAVYLSSQCPNVQEAYKHFVTDA